ncbi:MAG: ethanolamine utilization cob(I)yrinic acid a,c-diamide adenosyltransferase EutT [Desulfovibrio sp.]|jgi:ethanolamine utilization cobalamin adenosyltransferase|nr:ethanolamine utilization cob(I)yrinic acid a,c-diamide adenosyltransferase EutT [Desulfovibrio sp.]
MGQYITETWLRERFSLGHGTEIRLPAGSRLTPAAQGLLNGRKITVRYTDESGRVFLDETGSKRVNPLTGGSERQTSSCLMCRQPIQKKPDALTHLDASTLISKNDPRLKLRGKLDSAIAQAVLVQTEFIPQDACPTLALWLADIRSALGNALKSEVTGGLMPAIAMGDLDEETIHAISHNPLKYLGHDHLLPLAEHGAQVARLNLLRALIREAELYAADVYIARDFTVTRPDIMQGLNRLSSAVYVLMLLTYLAERGKTVPPERMKA